MSVEFVACQGPHGSRPSSTSTSARRHRHDDWCSKMEAMKPPALCLPCLPLLGPMHYDPCALYWVRRCRKSCHGRRSSAVADRFWSSSHRKSEFFEVDFWSPISFFGSISTPMDFDIISTQNLMLFPLVVSKREGSPVQHMLRRLKHWVQNLNFFCPLQDFVLILRTSYDGRSRKKTIDSWFFWEKKTMCLLGEMHLLPHAWRD
jgi:hypothetical protein